MNEWRVGKHYQIHVYEGDRPVATFHNPEDAQRAVDAVNGAAWQPIETAPMDGTRLLLFSYGEVIVGYYQPAWERLRSDGVMMSGDACWIGHDDYDGSTVAAPTHWMPLPHPPIET